VKVGYAAPGRSSLGERGDTARNLSEVEGDAMQLPLKERALLAERLLATLDTGDDIEVEELWLQEAERRYQEYRAGRIASKPAKQVFEDAMRSRTGSNPLHVS
jgi:putative addiction module component (TIGR02574 family)